MNWNYPEIVHHEPLMLPGEKKDKSWDKFRKMVMKNCDRYIKEKGITEIKGIYVARKAHRYQAPKKDVDAFFEKLYSREG